MKTEDIINRGGGNLVVQLYNSMEDESLANTDVIVEMDGVKRTIEAGGKVVLTPGESITLQPYCYAFLIDVDRRRGRRRIKIATLSD